MISELVWTDLHSITELTETKRFPPIRQKECVRGARRTLQIPKRFRRCRARVFCALPIYELPAPVTSLGPCQNS
jgi:hypothetical protein